MRLRWAASMAIAVGISILAPTVARTCAIQGTYDLESEVERADIVIKARMTDVELADVVAKDRRNPGRALAMKLETIRTYKGVRRSEWQVVLREVPTNGYPDLARWRERIGMTKIFALKPPFRDRDDSDWQSYWGAVPDGAGGMLYQIVSVPCAGNVIVEPDLKTELRIAFTAQRELVILTGVALVAGLAALIYRARRKAAIPEPKA
jgi:hypothetical protein